MKRGLSLIVGFLLSSLKRWWAGMNKDSRLTIRISYFDRMKIKRFAEDRKRSVSDVIREAINQILEGAK